jgi:HlyD family secretion protein
LTCILFMSINDIFILVRNLGKVKVNTMRILKIMLLVLVAGMLVIPMSSCGSEPDETASAENEIATVQRGDITLDITAAGNLALSKTEDLAFEVAGTVAEVLVEEGDSVEEGQVLASLDKEGWEDNLKTLAPGYYP